MYQLWRVFKRNPLVWNPRAFGALFLGYTLYSIYRQETLAGVFKWEDYCEAHPHSFEEKMRQYTRSSNLQFRAIVTAERAKLDEKLRAEA